MLNAIKQLLDSKVINESTHQEIQEAWDSKLVEAKESLREELREEFAQKYDHDKTVMVTALDKMVTEGLQTEIEEFAQEKTSLAEDRVKFQKKMTSNATKFNNFMVAKLSEEITELRKDRKLQQEGMNKVSKFVAKSLAKEISEFAADKRDLVESKVKLVAEAKVKLDSLKKKFVKESSAKVKAHIVSRLDSELTSLNEDIKAARENSFGRRIFEAFSSEFTSTHLNENAVIRKLNKKVEQANNDLKESKVKTAKLKQLTESKEKQIRRIKENDTRTKLLDELLSPLNESKREVMQNLLENVQTSRLNGTFEKYLPAVLANKKADNNPRKKTNINESVKSVSGNKTAKPQKTDEYTNNIVDIKKLAGL